MVNKDQKIGADVKSWVKPTVTKLYAGSAENSTTRTPIPDGTLNNFAS